MSVVIFPRQHLGQRQPGAFVLRLPLIEMTFETNVYTGVDALTQAAARSEFERLEAALNVALESSGRLVALMRPFVAEATR